MAAPTFIGAGAGVTIASGSGAVTAAGSGVAIGDLVILQVLQDGVAASAVTYSAISGIANLAGTASSLTTLAAAQPCGTLALQHLQVGRATSTTCTVTVATTGDDLYYRLYVFRGVAAGPAPTTIDYFPVANAIGQIEGDGGTSGEQIAQSFLVSAAAALSEVRVPLYKAGTPTDNLILEVRTDSGGVPSGTVVGTVATQAGTALTTTATVYSYACSITLAAGTYWLVARRSGARNIASYFRWSAISPGAYADGRFGNRGSGTWTTYPTLDALFGVTLGAGLADILENGTAGTVINGSGAGTSVADTGVTTLDTDRLALQLVALNDDVAIAAFTGMTGGTWAEAIAEYVTATGTDAAIQLQTATIASAGTINGGTATIATANWGVIGFALKPVAPTGTGHTVTPTDTVALTDTRTSARGKGVTDTLALLDSAARATAKARALADTVTVADLASPVNAPGGVAHTRPITDTLTLADSFARVMAYGRTQADGLVLVDSTRDAQGIRLGDILALTDQLARAATRVRTIADTLALSDATTRTPSKTRALTDAVALADSLARAVTKARALTDTVALTDLLTRATTKTRTQADTVALTDARALARAKTLTDTVALTDLLTRIAPRLRTFADSVLLSDAVLPAKVGAGALTITDLVALTDHVITQKIAAGAPILNYAIDIRWGTIQADNVYVGEELVWSP